MILQLQKFAAGGCSEEKLTVNGTEVRFGQALGNERANSTTSCLTLGSPPMALGICSGNFDDGYSWEVVRFYDCIYEKSTIDTKDPIGNEIKDLQHKMKVDPNAAVDSLLNFTKEKMDNLSTNAIDALNDLVKTTMENKETLNVEVGEKTVNVINSLFEASSKSDRESAADKSSTIMNLAETLENVLAKVELNESSEVTWRSENFVVHMAKPEGGEISFGMASTGDGTKEEHVSGKDLDGSPDVTVSVFLPRQAVDLAQNQTNKTVKASIIVYKRDVFLGRNSTNENRINSHVIMGSLDGGSVTNLTDQIRLRFQLYEKSDEEPKCVYAYHDKIEGKSTVWKWSDGGMTTNASVKGNHTIVECLSSHLTNFAVMAGFKNDVRPEVARALSVISIVGAVFSILCLLLVIVGQLLFKKFRRGQFQSALMNLSVALIMVNLLVLFGLDRTGNRRLCMAVAAFLHYFLLVSFSWMLVEAVLQYLKFVKVFNTHVSRFLLKAGAPAWGIPALIVLIIAVFDREQFRGPKEYCWLDKNAYHFAFLLPLALVVCTNSVIFGLIIKSISCDRPKGMQTNQTKGKLVWLQVQAGMCCFVVMGLTWSFALAAFGEIALTMQFLFAFFNSLQGFFIFILFNLREDPVRKAWSKLLKEKFGRPSSKVGKKKQLLSGETYTFSTTTKTSSTESSSRLDSSTLSESDTAAAKENNYSNMDTISE